MSNGNIQTGNVAEVRAALAFMRRSCVVSRPVGDGCVYDFVVQFPEGTKAHNQIDGSLAKIQCKKAYNETEKTIKFDTRRRTGEDYGDKIDFFVVVYDANFYLIPSKNTPKKSMRIRVSPPYRSDSNLATEYELNNWL